MTRKQFNVEKSIKAVHERAGRRCEYEAWGSRCLERSTEVAHRTGQGKGIRQHIENYIWYKYKKVIEWNSSKMDRIIHHPKNTRASCQKHNDYFSIKFQPVQRDALIDEIYEELF